MIYDLQKPTLFKRLSAWLFDLIMLAVLITAFATVISAVVGFDAKSEKLESLKNKYYEEYNLTEVESNEEYQKLTKEEQQRYLNAEKAFQKDPEVIKTNTLVFNLILIITALSILFAVIVWEIIVPLFLKNGQTLGKKIFGVAVMRTNGVKITPVQLFIRSVLGKYTLEIMIPVFSVILFLFVNAGVFGLAMIAIVFIAQIICLAVTKKTRSALHDLMADTVTVDLASQLIFDTEEELIKYKEEQHAKMVDRSPY